MGLTKVELKGLDDGTDGQIITYDASGNPVAVGPGTDGQVLTSTGAGSPPAFEDAAAGGAALTGSTNNTITTVTGANAIQGEANLTFDGEQLNVTHAGTTDPENQIVLQTSAIDTGGGSGIFFKSSSSTNANRYGSRIHTTRESGGASNLIFSTELTGGTTGLQEALKISPNKNVTVSDGDLVIGTAGHGIDFSAQTGTSATGAATGTASGSEKLSHYEEGTWTPTWHGGSNFNYDGSNSNGEYVKVGSLVHIRCFIGFGNPALTSGGQSWDLIVGGLPFAPSVAGYGTGVISVRCNSLGSTVTSSSINGLVSSSAAQINLRVATGTTSPGDTNLTAAAVGNYSSFAVQGTYHTTGL